MSAITKEEFEMLSALATKIADETKRNNALALLQRMTEVVEGMGDKVITWAPTQVKVLQALSNMDGISADNPRDVAAGALVAGARHMKNGTKVIPLMFWASRSLWDPNKDNPVKLCNSPDAKVGWKYGECRNCTFGKSEEEGKAPPCNKEQTFLVVAEDLSDIYRITFHKSQYRSGLDWGKEIQATRTHPYKRVFSLHGESLEKNKKIKYIKARLEDIRENSISPDVMAFLEAMYRKQLDDRKGYLEQYHKGYQDRLIQVNQAALEDKSEGEQEYIPADITPASGEDTPNYTL